MFWYIYQWINVECTYATLCWWCCYGKWHNEKVYINTELLIETTYYNYLDMIFSSRLCQSTALSVLIANAMIFLFNCSLTYLINWEIWGYTVRDEIENVHRMFVNMFYVFHLKHLQQPCLENVGDSHCQFNIFLDVRNIGFI